MAETVFFSFRNSFFQSTFQISVFKFWKQRTASQTTFQVSDKEPHLTRENMYSFYSI